MAFSEPSKDGREAEAVLMVVSDDPAAVHSKIARLDTIADMALGPITEFEADDSYFDTPAHTLSERGLALRLRRLGDRTLVGLKGEEEWTEKSVLRLELEASWSSNAFADVLHELGFRNIRFTAPGFAISGKDPAEVLGAIGLVPIQTRHLVRSARPVLGGNGETVGELASDIVTQEIGGTSVVYREIEVEASDASNASGVSQLSDRLLADFPDDLRNWSHSKLANGAALERLARTGALAGLVGADGQLTGAGIEALAKELTGN
jgi:inorganic triphosphatase YgiF